MNLLIVTQKVDKNDPILGFFHRWIIEFAKHCESIIVVCLEEGTHKLPANVRVLSLGKENKNFQFPISNFQFIHKLRYALSFYNYIGRERKNYDAVFVHMNPEYIVMGGLIWKLMGKKATLWYTHKNVDLKLRIAEKLSDRIFTASPESFRLKSHKLAVVGHGIDTDMFAPASDPSETSTRGKTLSQSGSPYTIISVARISPVKNELAMVEAVKILRERGFPSKLILVGAPVTHADFHYEAKIKDYIHTNNLSDVVECSGAVEPERVIGWYRKADMYINLSATGSLDKAALEAMACGLQVLSSNEALRSILPPINFTDGTPEDIAAKIEMLSRSDGGPQNREYVLKNHNLNTLISRLCEEIKSL